MTFDMDKVIDIVDEMLRNAYTQGYEDGFKKEQPQEQCISIGVGDICKYKGVDDVSPLVVTRIQMCCKRPEFSGVYVDGNTIDGGTLDLIQVLIKANGRTVPQMLELADKMYRRGTDNERI